MTDQLRQRRRVLLQELSRLEADLARRASTSAPWPSETWRRQAAAAPQFLALLDADLRVRWVNRSQPGADRPGDRTIFDYVAAELREPLQAAVSEALASGLPQYFEAESEGPHRQRSQYSNWLVPVNGEGGTRIAIIAADIGHERRIEQQLEQEKSLFESLVANAPDSVVIVDRDHRIQFVNHTLDTLPREDVLGRQAEDFVAPAFRQRVHDAIEHVLATGRTTSYETETTGAAAQRWYSVRVGPVLQNGEIARVSMVSTEITRQVERDRAWADEQAKLAESERRFRTLVDYAPEALVIFDVDSGRFVDVNDNACRLFGLDRTQLLNLGPADVSPEFQPDGSPSSLAAMSRIQDSVEGEHSVFEWTHRNAEGQDVPCEVRLVRLPHQGRRWVRGSLIDISERKRAEAERERLTLELAQAQKMQALGQLTGGVAHDFNNLLTVIMSSMEMIDIDPDAPDGARGHARQALAAAERAAALTQRLLAFARRQPLRPQVVDINGLVVDAESLLRRTLGGSTRISTSLAEALWPCEADPTQLENLILNLAINARDAMPDGGHLTIETANAVLTAGDLQDHRDVEPGDYVGLSVIDTGCGMTDDVVQQVFEPFFTTKPTGRGSGLGLSMVYGFVKQSRGHVAIDSRPDAGTRVDVYLPRSGAAQALKPVDSALTPAAAPRGEDRLVLVVDDDAAVRALVVQTLAALDYRTVDAADAATAMALLDTTPDVALVLSDVVLADGTHGPALARRVRAAHPGLPMLFMSGYAEYATGPDGRLPPDIALLEKPFSRDQLGRAVWNAIHPRDPLHGEDPR